MQPIDVALASVLDVLRELDTEAGSVVDGYPTGLRWLHGHLRGRVPPGKKDKTEDFWADELVRRLPGRPGIASVRPPRYAYPRYARRCGDGVRRGSCDLVLALIDETWTWVELKGAWPYLRDGLRPDVLKPNSAHPRHTTVTTAHDFLKSRPLRPPEASHAAVVVAAFDVEGDEEYEIPTAVWDEMKANGSVRDDGWRETDARSWPDDHQRRAFAADGRRYRATLRTWSRALA